MELPSLPSIPSPEAAAVKLAVEVLKVYLGREDLKDTVRLEMENRGLKDALLAEQWMRASESLPDRGAALGVRDGGQPIVLQGDDPGA